MEVKAIKCPSCGANVDPLEGKDTMFCQYCGTKIMITDENTFTVRHEDVAEIKRIELEKYKLESDRSEREDGRREAIRGLVTIFAFILFIGGGLGISEGRVSTGVAMIILGVPVSALAIYLSMKIKK